MILTRGFVLNLIPKKIFSIFIMTKDESTEKIVTMEDILSKNKNNKTDNPSSKENNKTTNKRKPKDIQDSSIRGQPKSGRFWKTEKKKFSTVIKTKGIKSSFERKEALRKKLQQIKEASRELKAKKQEEVALKKERRRENLRRQEENRKKSEIVQVITNTKKLKKMRKKQLRFIEKRDTTTVKK